MIERLRLPTVVIASVAVACGRSELLLPGRDGGYSPTFDAAQANVADGAADSQQAEAAASDAPSVGDSGAEANTCGPCPAGFGCVNGQCGNVDWTCGPTNCGGCCYPRGYPYCVPGTAPDLCGVGGEPCYDCSTAVCDALPAGGGECSNAKCSGASCAGCCIGGTCAIGAQDFACGVNGASCANCEAVGQRCVAGSCLESCCGARTIPPRVLSMQPRSPERDPGATTPYGLADSEARYSLVHSLPSLTCSGVAPSGSRPSASS